jgi:hypothetical protein
MLRKHEASAGEAEEIDWGAGHGRMVSGASVQKSRQLGMTGLPRRVKRSAGAS